MNLALELGMEVVHVPTPEAEILRIVIAALNPVTVHEEHRIGDYVVDAYVPVLNLVIERDRLNDPRRDRSAEWWRQVTIEDWLGCKFVRFDPTRRDFNVGALVNEVLRTDLPEQADQTT